MAAATEQALRRLVSDLAKAGPDDIDAVLNGLNANQRTRVRRMLAEYLGQRLGAPVAANRPRDLPGLSAWLADRLAVSAGGSSGREPAFALTERTRQALQDCAVALAPAAVERRDVAQATCENWLVRLRTLAGGARTA